MLPQELKSPSADCEAAFLDLCLREFKQTSLHFIIVKTLVDPSPS